VWNLANDTIFGDIIAILCDGSLAMLKYLSVIVCLLVALEKNYYIWYFNAYGLQFMFISFDGG